MKKVFQFGYILMGLLIIGVGASLLSVGGLGVDPFTAFNMSLADRLHLTLGVTQLCMNLVLFVYVFLNDKTSIGWGTIMNMTLVGVFIQYISDFLQQYNLGSVGFWGKLLILLIGIVFFTLGAAIYMSGDMGAAPYDSIAPILTKQLHGEYNIIRSWQDITFVVLAFVLAGMHHVGLGTIVAAFGSGSLIAVWTKLLPKFPAQSFFKNK
ncbi:YczE/YyaS/YitT family protein [Weissella viridescens]|uniref:YczE/YyaS/YitT family protein n=1 Tax=Weissella viridescens TaxID=1629 RepID=UPI001747119F|nr:hypothetical protein [Weissella viridescens]MBX4173267.1 hypothetical protein [Weissella viridescens]QOD85918.1 hypothetical protein IE337_07035 [Weissella viridescens]